MIYGPAIEIAELLKVDLNTIGIDQIYKPPTFALESE